MSARYVAAFLHPLLHRVGIRRHLGPFQALCLRGRAERWEGPIARGRDRASILSMMILARGTVWLRGTAMNQTGGRAGRNGRVDIRRVRHGSLQACQVGLGRLSRIQELVFRVHGSVVGLLRAITTRTYVGAVGKNDWHIEHIHWLPG